MGRLHHHAIALCGGAIVRTLARRTFSREERENSLAYPLDPGRRQIKRPTLGNTDQGRGNFRRTNRGAISNELSQSGNWSATGLIDGALSQAAGAADVVRLIFAK